MREIKFRAWDKVNSKMFTVDYLEYPHNHYREPTKDLTIGTFEDDNYHSWDNMELMQYTGLKDKNSREIYEGDIVRGSGWNSTLISEVKFHSFCGWPNIRPETVEVIGNVYEDLIK